MSLFKEILGEMGEYEEETHRDYADQGHACEHAKDFLDRAANVLQFNNKDNNDEDVVKLAKNYARDYYNAIVDELDHLNGDKEYNADDHGYDSNGDYDAPNSFKGNPDKQKRVTER